MDATLPKTRTRARTGTGIRTEWGKEALVAGKSIVWARNVNVWIINYHYSTWLFRSPPAEELFNHIWAESAKLVGHRHRIFAPLFFGEESSSIWIYFGPSLDFSSHCQSLPLGSGLAAEQRRRGDVLSQSLQNKWPSSKMDDQISLCMPRLTHKASIFLKLMSFFISSHSHSSTSNISSSSSSRDVSLEAKKWLKWQW